MAPKEIETFKEFSETIYGFGLIQLCSFVVTLFGVYVAVWWNERNRKKEEKAKHQRFLESIFFQIKFRQQKINEALIEPLNSNKLDKMNQANLDSLSNFLPTQETISNSLNDLALIGYFSSLRDQLEWSSKERSLKGSFADLYIMGLLLQKFELALIRFLEYDSAKEIWVRSVGLYCDLPYFWLEKFGVTIGAQHKITPAQVSDDNFDVISPATIVALAISDLVEGKESIDWKTNNEQKEKLFVSLYEVGAKIEGYHDPKVHNLMKELFQEKGKLKGTEA